MHVWKCVQSLRVDTAEKASHCAEGTLASYTCHSSGNGRDVRSELDLEARALATS